MERRKDRFRIFTRTWWKENPAYPNGLEPEIGPATTIDYAPTARDARRICAEWNAKHPPGRYSRKAEFSEDIGQ